MTQTDQQTDAATTEPPTASAQESLSGSGSDRGEVRSAR